MRGGSYRLFTTNITIKAKTDRVIHQDIRLSPASGRADVLGPLAPDCGILDLAAARAGVIGEAAPPGTFFCNVDLM